VQRQGKEEHCGGGGDKFFAGEELFTPVIQACGIGGGGGVVVYIKCLTRQKS
jgi:hypothetical protein